MSLLCDVLFSAQSRCSSTLIRLQRCQFVANKRTIHRSQLVCPYHIQTNIYLHTCLPLIQLPTIARNFSCAACVATQKFCKKRPSPFIRTNSTWARYLPLNLSTQGLHMAWKQPHTASNTNSRSKQNQESMQTLNHFIRQTPDLVFAFSGCVQRVTAWYPFDPDFIADHC